MSRGGEGQFKALAPLGTRSEPTQNPFKVLPSQEQFQKTVPPSEALTGPYRDAPSTGYPLVPGRRERQAQEKPSHFDTGCFLTEVIGKRPCVR